MAYSQYANVPTGAGNTVVRSSAGSLGTVVVTTTGTGTGTVNFYDNASTNSGQVLLAIPATATAGQIFVVGGAVKNGIVVTNVASGPVLTVFYD